MLTTNLIRKVSKIHADLECVYQKLLEDRKTAGQFHIGEAAEFLRLAMLVMRDAERKVA
jgi:hypothetical protein